ncbi:MAG: SDR family NAD(P)-dependent oxidoreductase, partial [Acidimicrobiales bacterium]|nr:SDR family NAD(P)-dependent oxidoreductase [Acidimicrobiales bacterium]
ADPDGCAAVEARLAADDEPIDLLVNNAGFGTAGAFWELPLDGEAREVALNAVAVLRLSHAALGPMVARGRGAVVNVSSLASNQPTPGMATYGATKAFVT